MSLTLKLLAIKKLAKMIESLYLGTFAVSSKLSVKSKTGKSQRVRDKTYKVANLIRGRASIISMDIHSMA